MRTGNAPIVEVSPNPRSGAAQPTGRLVGRRTRLAMAYVRWLSLGRMRIEPRIVRRLTHDTRAFTQGLAYHRGVLYESCGHYAGIRSSLSKLSPHDGHAIQRTDIPSDFAEGIAVVEDQIVQVSWKSGQARIFCAESLKLLKTLTYEGEGWGLSAFADGTLIMSNGSHRLSIRDPTDFRPLRQISVRSWGWPIPWLNDLEYAHGFVFANIWKLPDVGVIHPATGRLVALVDCSRLIREVAAEDPESVLNGIAYNGRNQTFFVTGKNWPTIFELEIPMGGVLAR